MDALILFLPFVTAAYMLLANDPLLEQWWDDLMEALDGRRNEVSKR